MTTHQLESRLTTLRGQVRRLLAVHGLSRLVALTVTLGVVFGFLDWLFHLDSVIRAVRLGLIVAFALMARVFGDCPASDR